MGQTADGDRFAGLHTRKLDAGRYEVGSYVVRRVRPSRWAIARWDDRLEDYVDLGLDGEPYLLESLTDAQRFVLALEGKRDRGPSTDS